MVRMHGCMAQPAAPHECMPLLCPPWLWDADSRQRFYTTGSSVADTNTHKTSRGYGIVLGQVPPPPGEEGPPRLRVKFEHGVRTTTLQPSSVDLSIIHHDSMLLPTALQQRVLVNVGASKGKTGVTEAKVGATLSGRGMCRVSSCPQLKLHAAPRCNPHQIQHSLVPSQQGERWSVRLDGQERLESFPTWRLHALEAADPAKAMQPFEPTQLEAALPVEGIPSWIAAYCGNPEQPASLRLRRPDSNLWLRCVTKQLDLDQLTDADLTSLRYVCSGQRPDLQGGAGQLLWEAGDVHGLRLPRHGRQQQECYSSMPSRLPTCASRCRPRQGRGGSSGASSPATRGGRQLEDQVQLRPRLQVRLPLPTGVAA